MDSEADLQERLIEWKEIFESESREDGDALGRAAEKIKPKLNQRDSFVYLGGAVCGDGGTEMEIHRRLQAGASAWK